MIRPAIPDDAAKAVPLILDAIGVIASVLSGTPQQEETAAILEDFFRQETNRLSYQNALVLEEAGELAGVAILYDGGQARALDAPLECAAAERSGRADYRIPTEPEAGEFYLDTLSVSPAHQRKGYGSRLIEAACEKARERGHRRLALLVEVDHGPVIRLYKRMGFYVDYIKQIAGQDYFHMVRRL